MEPFEIDKIIKQKLQESSDLHKHEIESAKPFVWSAIQNQIGLGLTLSWYHLVAAVIILIAGFSIILFNIQKVHKKEMILLSDKIDLLETNFVAQTELISAKESQVQTLGNELKQVELQLMGLQGAKNTLPKEMIIHRVDTIYLREIEYITAVSDPIEENETKMSEPALQSEKEQLVVVRDAKVDEDIFPSYSSQVKNAEAETIKFKFGGSFASRKN